MRDYRYVALCLYVSSRVVLDFIATFTVDLRVLKSVSRLLFVVNEILLRIVSSSYTFSYSYRECIVRSFRTAMTTDSGLLSVTCANKDE